MIQNESHVDFVCTGGYFARHENHKKVLNRRANRKSFKSLVFFGILGTVLVYFFNDFSAVLGKTEKLPMEIAVWMPIVIVFLFSAVGIIHANQK